MNDLPGSPGVPRGFPTSIQRRIRHNKEPNTISTAKHRPSLGWCRRTEREEEDFLGSESVLAPKVYDSLDAACENYRQELLAQSEGREHEIGEALNPFLRELPVPDGPFAAEIMDEGEWWKRGEE
jgi:hypothetical protein